MEKKLIINFGENKIVAEVYPTGLIELPYELCIYLCDKDNAIFQDICMVRPHYVYNGKYEIDNNFVDCLVWDNPNVDDFTYHHVIGVHEWEE